METQAGDAGAFIHFDLNRVPSPCFVIDEVAVENNLRILQAISTASGARIFSALKAFSLPDLAPLISQYLQGCCASGLHEARLARDFYSGELATYCAAYKPADMQEIIALSDHLIFNTPSQKSRFHDLITSSNRSVQIGLRINPEHAEGLVEKYDPCAPCSRLGTPVSQLTAVDLEGIDGLHMHTLCEQEFAPLERTWQAVLPKLKPLLPRLKWINLGGGHHITRKDYDRDALIRFIRELQSTYSLDVYLEPGEAVVLDAGILVGELLDLGFNGMPLAITDISATCHMPDVIEAPYRPDMMGEAAHGTLYRLGGPSCLAGDVIGDYRFSDTPRPGQRLAFLDQAHYSLVKTNTFNGIPLPAIAVWNSDSDALRIVRQFGYEDFLTRLS
ncbi:MAG: carboxynorspermidine decarboxylase [Granulosicoccus sp.]